MKVLCMMRYYRMRMGLRTSAVFLLLTAAFGPCYGQRVGCPVAEDRTRHDVNGMVLDYPSNWLVQSGEDSGVRALAIFPDGFTIENAPCSVQVLWMQAPEGATLDAAAESLFKQFEQREPRTKRTGPIRRGSLDGSPSITIPFTAPDSNGVDWDNGELIVRFHSGELLAVIPETYAATWPRVSPALARIVNSIRLNAATATPSQINAYDPALMITRGPKQFRHPEFSFQYPGNWGITPGETETAAVYRSDNQGTPFYRFRLQPLDGTENDIVISYHKFPPDKLCGSIAEWMEGVLNVEYTMSFFDQRNITERFPAGAVFTTKASRSAKLPGMEILRSTVCSNGQVVTVAFGYQPGYPATARDMILRTLSFSGLEPTLKGSWEGTGSVLTFEDGGTAQLAFDPPNQAFSRRGTYSASGQQLTITWKPPAAFGRQEVWNCSYKFTSGELHLGCGTGTQVYHRSGVQ